MSTQHTPGPWTINKVCPWTINHLLYDEPLDNKNVVCRMPDRNPETEANAQLIAAAPELLSALETLMQRAVKDAEHYAPDGNEPIWAFIMDASNAIAKATRGAK
jgi:hypothetical protein